MLAIEALKASWTKSLLQHWVIDTAVWHSHQTLSARNVSRGTLAGNGARGLWEVRQKSYLNDDYVSPELEARICVCPVTRSAVRIESFSL